MFDPNLPRRCRCFGLGVLALAALTASSVSPSSALAAAPEEAETTEETAPEDAAADAGDGAEQPSERKPGEPDPSVIQQPPGAEATPDEVGEDKEKVRLESQEQARQREAEEKARAEAEEQALVQAEKDRYNRKNRPWIKRWRPERNTIELGVFGGMFFANPDHDFYDPKTRPPEPLWRISPDVGVRLGYFPLRALGVEAEFSAVPSRMRTITNDPVFLYGFRGHAIAQLPFYNVVPFFLAGYGLMGIKSNVILLGDDIDPAFHYGGGVKVYFTRHIGARIEARNIISARENIQNSGVSHVQVLAGLTFTWLRAKPKKLPPMPPPEDPDRDNDGFLNNVDACPDDAGVEPDGCPDSDGDGFPDKVDKCPTVPGVEPDGCPVEDTDSDGIMDPDDECVFKPENYNGFEDEDGCPDELPPQVKEFTGTIEGIEFDFNKDTIRPVSKPVLDKAIGILDEFPDIRVKIVGHTDDVGTEEFNQDLSRRRAESVKKYMVDGGIAGDRIETEGLGSADPLVPNDSDANRARNRRIEFQVVDQSPEGAAGSKKKAEEDAAKVREQDEAEAKAAAEKADSEAKGKKGRRKKKGKKGKTGDAK
jgi:outer membrane protein OmpA-like peptidoglycan-associated protein